MTTPRTGFTFTRYDDDPQPLVNLDMSTVFLWGPSEDATPSFFPLNGLVEFNSSDILFLANIGTGALSQAIPLINAQLGDFQVAARIVALRTAYGASQAEAIANMVGSQAAGTGLFAALRAGPEKSVIPRLFCPAPGFTGVFTRSAATTTVTRTAKFGGNTGTGLMTLAGSPYGVDVKPGVYQVRCVGGARSGAATAKVGNTGNGTLGALTVDATAPIGTWKLVCGQAAVNGGAFTVIRPDGSVDGIASVGVAYNSANGPNFTLADGSTDFIVGDEIDVAVTASVPVNGGLFSVIDPDGIAIDPATVGVAYTGTKVQFSIADGATDFVVGDGFDVTVSKVGGVAQANPILAALPQVLNALIAHAVVGGPGLTKQDALDWRETINCDRIIPVDCWVTPAAADDGVFVDGAPAIVGIGVRRDFESKGGRGVPSTSWHNQPVQGIRALKRYDAFSWLDGATDAQEIFSANVGVIVRGELGVESAVSDSGFVFLGSDNAGDDELWRFYNVQRVRDWTHLQLIRSWRKRIGRENITLHGVQAVINDAIVIQSDLKRDEHIVGGKPPEFVRDRNSPENIRAGRIRMGIRQEEASPLLAIDTESRRDRDSLDVLIATLASSTNTVLVA